MPDKKQKMKTLARNIKANPDDSFSKFALALEFLKQDNLQRAKVLFEDVYKNEPGYLGVYYHLGKLYEQIGRMEDAKQIYSEGIEVAEQQKEHRTKKELEEALTEVNFEIESQ